ncbi:MAG: hypothetical protein KAF64_15985 [Hydrogenophaga sp.]|nr:hypothetical protein [Hydrogenophaga sp.]
MVFGSQSARARTVLVYGNCQAPYLAQMLASLDDLNGDYRFVVALNHALPGDALAPAIPDEDLKDVALLLRQFEDQQDNPALTALTERLPAHCPVIRYPSFALLSAWPFECPEPRVHHDPAYTLWKRYPLGDMLGLRIAQAGLTGPMAVAAYMDLSERKMPDLRVRLQRDIDRMRHYDAHSDVQLADYVLDRFRDEHLFWTSGHMSAPAMAELTRRVAGHARPVLGGSAARAEACLAAASHDGGMGVHQHPIHPLVAEALELRFWRTDFAYRWHTQQWTYYEYIQRYIEYDTSW